MLWTSCEPISLGMGFDLFDLLLTFGASGAFRGMACTLQVPCLREYILPGACFQQLDWNP